MKITEWRSEKSKKVKSGSRFNSLLSLEENKKKKCFLDILVVSEAQENQMLAPIFELITTCILKPRSHCLLEHPVFL